MTSALARAASYLTACHLTRAVVDLHPEAVSDGDDYYPRTVAAWRADGTRDHGVLSTLAELVWAAAQERGAATGPVQIHRRPAPRSPALPAPGSAWLVERVEAEECRPCCGLGGTDEPCEDCGGTGWTYRPKRQEGAA